MEQDYIIEVCEQEITAVKPLFSFLMCVYNDTSLLDRAIDSLIQQAYTNWELIILDNSDKNEAAWELVKNAVRADRRIRAYKSIRNVGWAKGAAICLQYARGEYTTFLAADDCINAGAFEVLKKEIDREAPDVIWVGNGLATYEEGIGIVGRGKKIPQYAVYGTSSRSKAITEIMRNVYYNSLFHYMRVDFLKKHQIDFFEPYHMDCAGMTKALTAADKMVVLDYLVYFLTLNTSQTAGIYTWDSYRLVFAKQWDIIKEVFVRENYVEHDEICQAAKGIFLNLIGNVEALCRARCRDKYMMPMQIHSRDIILQMEAILENESVQEMMLLVGEETGFSLFYEKISLLQKSEIEDEMQKSWLKPFFCICREKNLSIKAALEYIIDFLLKEENKSCFGFWYFEQCRNAASDSVIYDLRSKIECVLKKYENFLSGLKEDIWLSQVL